jgi:serine/threonine-protein kinase mTOR
MLVNMTGMLEDFFPAIAIAILMRYIRDPSLAQHHTTVVQAITFIFKSLGTKCIPYLAQVVPAYLHVIRTSDATFREVSENSRLSWLYGGCFYKVYVTKLKLPPGGELA